MASQALAGTSVWVFCSFISRLFFMIKVVLLPETTVSNKAGSSCPARALLKGMQFYRLVSCMKTGSHLFCSVSLN